MDEFENRKKIRIWQARKNKKKQEADQVKHWMVWWRNVDDTMD